jgi:hypothetical protein
MSNNLNDTMSALRRLATAGAVGLAVLLVGAVLLPALSVLLQLSQFSPFGLWGALGVLVVAALAGLIAWRGGLSLPGSGRPRRTLPADMVIAAPPAPPLPRPIRERALTGSAGRLGAQAAINRLIEDGRYGEALDRLAELEASDPALATFALAKRRTVSRRQARLRATR